MATSVATSQFTYEDLLDLPDDGNRHEIIAGELLVTAAPGKKHQWVSVRLTSWLHTHVDERQLGEVYHAPVDVRLNSGNIVQPDLIFISRERRDIFSNQVVEGPPDLVVEILSPSTRTRDQTIKLSLYLSAGVREYWVVDPDKLMITMYVLSAAGGYQRIEVMGGSLRSSVLPDLAIDVKALFADLV